MEQKAQEILPEDIWNKEKSEAIVQFVLEKRQKELDEFAIGFGQWMTSGVEFMDDTERGRVYYFKKQLYTTEELLEIYKKEKGL